LSMQSVDIASRNVFFFILLLQ